MPEYALYRDSTFTGEIRTLSEQPPSKGDVSWHPVVREHGEVFEGLVEGDHVIRTCPTSGQIDRERDRRVANGFMFNDVLFQSRAQDQKRISGAGALAIVAVINGAQPNDLRWHGGDSDFAWIAADNSLVTMDAQTVIAFGQAAAAWESAHVFAARALKDMSPPPEAYDDDQYWPELPDAES